MPQAPKQVGEHLRREADLARIHGGRALLQRLHERLAATVCGAGKATGCGLGAAATARHKGRTRRASLIGACGSGLKKGFRAVCELRGSFRRRLPSSGRKPALRAKLQAVKGRRAGHSLTKPSAIHLARAAARIRSAAGR